MEETKNGYTDFNGYVKPTAVTGRYWNVKNNNKKIKKEKASYLSTKKQQKKKEKYEKYWFPLFQIGVNECHFLRVSYIAVRQTDKYSTTETGNDRNSFKLILRILIKKTNSLKHFKC